MGNGFEHHAHLITIAGASCSGKTTLAERLAHALGGAVVLSMDRYYRDLSHLPPHERASTNFDHPDALEHELLTGHVERLLAGEAIEAPRYDYRVHSREPQGDPIEPQPYVIVEGLYALHWGGLRERAYRRVFIDVSETVCLERRMRRDTEERGRSIESIHAQFVQTVQPMYESFIFPSRKWADIVVDGELTVEQLVELIARHTLAGEPQAEA